MKIQFPLFLIIILAACSQSRLVEGTPVPALPSFLATTTETIPAETFTMISRPTETSSPTPEFFPTPSMTETFAKTSAPTDPPPPNTSGAYILSDFAILHPDGSGMRRIDFPHEYSLYNYSPDGEWGVLFAGGYSSGYGGACIDCGAWDEMSLNILHVPDGKIIRVSLVVTHKVLLEKHNYGECGTPLFEMISVKWSPDGRFLAFIADPTGTSLDLFTYDTDNQILHRLTNDNADVLDISWSPDGKKLFYINGMHWEHWRDHPDDTYATHTLNMTEPENGANQGIQTFYSGRKKVTILWMDHEDGLIYSTTDDVWCMTGGDEASRPTEINYLNLESGETSPIWPESASSAKAFDPINRTILIVERKGDNTANGFIVNVKGEIIASIPEVAACQDVKYFGGPTDAFLCVSMEKKEIIGISNGGKTHAIDNLPNGGRIGVAFDKKWFVIYHPEGINLYSRKGELVNQWAHALNEVDFDSVTFLWAPDGNGFYFALEGRHLYYWPFSNPNPALVFDGQSPDYYFFRFLIWVK
jgi:WD40 repeat protein